MSAPDSAPLEKLSCPEGYELAREILCPLVEFDPHDYQLEGICKALDGHHLLAIIPTGGGKSIFYFGYILLMKHLKHDTRVHISLRDKWPEKPGLLYVSPTNGLELEQAFVWQRKYGLKCITINVDTVRLASEAKPPRNLWKEAEFADVILLSPERLIGKSCQDFIHVDEVWERLCALGVDEIQFLDTWGPTFRTAFLQIANAHRRLRPGTIIIATTATLPSGPPRTRILRHVGLGDVDYHEIHRSNIRPNVRMDFRPLSSGLRGHAFPDLKWLLKDGRKTIIFCQSINLTFRAFVYLWHLCPGTTAEKSTRIRMYTAAHSEAYNSQTRELMHSDPLAQIILATDTLSVGVDFRGIWIVIILGEDQTADMVIQKFGRVARDIRLVREGLAILFFTKNAVKTAQVIVDAGQPAKPDPSRKMDFSMAKMLVAPCLRAVQDELFDNPAEDSICTCTTCTAALADVCASSGTAEQSTTSRTTSTGACNCGRCDPRPLPHTAPPTAPTARGQTKRDPTKLTGLQRQEARARLATLRQQLYLEGIAGDPTLAFSTPPSEFLPSDVADSVLLNWHHISHADDLAPYLSGASLLVTHCARLYDFINDLMPELDAIRKAAAAESTRKRAATVATKKAAKLAAETAADSSLDAVDAAPDVADEALLQHQAAPDVAPDQPSAPANAMDRSCRATGASDPRPLRRSARQAAAAPALQPPADVPERASLGLVSNASESSRVSALLKTPRRARIGLNVPRPSTSPSTPRKRHRENVEDVPSLASAPPRKRRK